ncbi:MAG: SNF2-related protein [Erysipelotrichaceae bacterium]|nr:SNF2-related protein [Erysipelotrichaceae bacterium]
MNKIEINQIIKDASIKDLAEIYLKFYFLKQIDIVDTKQGYHITCMTEVYKQRQICHVILDNDFQYVSSSCNCQWSNDLPCPHVIATILWVNCHDIDTLPYHYVENRQKTIEEARKKREQEIKKQRLLQLTSISRNIIAKNRENYNTQLLTAFQNVRCELEPILIDDGKNHLSIEYRIGNEKKYVLKNISEFLERIAHQENYKYGKSLEFIHNEDAFDEFALKQIKLMRQVDEYIYWLNQRSYYNRYELARSIPINGNTIDNIFDAYYNVEEENDYGSFQCINTQEPISLDLIDNGDYYTLTLTDQYNLSGIKHAYNIYKKDNRFIISRIQLDDHRQVMELLEELEEKDMDILKSDYPQFNKYVLSPIIDYLDIKLPPQIESKNYDIIRIYGDVEENDIYFQVYYLDEDNNRIVAFNQDNYTNYKQDLVEQYILKYATKLDEKTHKVYFSLDNEDTYEFVNEGLVFLQDYAEIFVSDTLKRVGQAAHYHISVGVKIDNHLLALDFESDQIPKEELHDILRQYKRKKKFYRLKNGELLYLNSPELEELDEFMDQYHIDYKDIKNGHLQLSEQRMFAINEDATNMEYIEIDRKASFKKEIDRFYHMTPQDHPIPAKYDKILRDYQKEGFMWLNTLRDYGFNGILADDMGLGKTLQVIALLESLGDCTSLVVCPASLIYNWEDEVYKFTDSLKIKCIVGTPDERKDIINHYQDYQLLITSYDYMRRDFVLYEDKSFEYVILDEAQNIKNQKTQNALTVKTLHASHKLALTGTPIENTLAELWSIFDFLMPDYLFNYHYFKKYYENDIVKYNNEDKMQYLKKLVAPFILRRNKRDVLNELPDKIETTQIIPFSNEESKIYHASLAQANEELQALLNVEVPNKIQILSLLTRLRQLCCEPRLVYENIDNVSSKMKATVDLILNFKENHQKVLLFSSFTSVLDLLEEELKLQGISYYTLTGSTKKEERRTLVSQFQNDDTDVFLISLKAGGTGLNLTAASAVIHYDPWWNISAQNQATDRAYRIGQNKNVQVFYMVMKGSIEEKIIDLQKQKKELADIFVEGNDVNLSQMSKEELLELFS